MRTPIQTARPSGIVLAGGRSLRMGHDKGHVDLGGKVLLQHAAERLAPQVSSLAVNANRPPAWTVPPDIPVIADPLPDYPGPLAGILAGLRHARQGASRQTHLAVIPVDTPFFPRDLVQRLADSLTGEDQIAVACSDGHMHPVFALWPLSLAEDLETFLRTDEKRRVRGFMERYPLNTVDFPAYDTEEGLLDPFFNINTPDDLEKAGQLLGLIERKEQE